MQKVGNLFLTFILTFVLAIPISLQFPTITFADERIQGVEANGKLFDNNHESKSWKSNGSNIRVDIWFDIAGDRDSETFNAKLKLQKKDGNKFKDTNQTHTLKPKGKDKKQQFEFNGLKKGDTYRLYIDGYNQIGWNNNRVSYKVYNITTPTNQYELKPNYTFKRGSDDVLKFTIHSTKENKDQKLRFDGNLAYTVKKSTGKQTEDNKQVSSGSKRELNLDKFTDAYLSEAWKKGDANHSQTIVNVTYTGKIDGGDVVYRISKEFRIERNSYSLELNTENKDGKLKASAKTTLGNGVKDRKWSFVLKDKDGDKLKTNSAEDNNRTAQTSFERADFSGKKSGSVTATFTGKMYSDRTDYDKVILYTASKKKNVDAPPEPQDNGNGGNNNGGSNNGGSNNGGSNNGGGNNGGNNDDGNNNGGNNNGGNNNGGNDKGGNEEEKENKDATIDISSKILKDNKVEIKASLKKVDDPKGTWKLKFNDGEEKTYKNENGSITKTFSTKNIEKDKVKVTAKFTGKDKKGTINKTKTEEVKVKEEKEQDNPSEEDNQGNQSGNDQGNQSGNDQGNQSGSDQGNQSGNDQGDQSGNDQGDQSGNDQGNNEDNQGDQSGNDQDNPPAEENKDAKISITPTILDNDQVEIKTSLENAEEPKGTWTLTFNEGEPKTFKDQGASITETYNTKDIKTTQVPVTAKFVGKDKENKTIEQEITEQVTVKKETTPPVEDTTGDDGGTTTDDEDEVIGEVVTPPNSPSGQVGGELPKTATNYSTGLIAGILLLISGGLVLIWRRRTT